jgi:signal transduction histidine kinase
MMLRLSADGVILDYKANRDSYLLALPQLLLGKNVQDVMPPIVAQKTQAAISQALHSDGTHIFEYSLLEDNKQLDFEARVVICGHDEVLVIVRDITERKKIDRMKNEFVSIVSHELRTPLTAISGALGLLSGNVLGQLPPKAVEMIDIAHRNTKRLIRLINDLLDIDKIESGNMVYQLKSLDIVPLVIQSIQANQAYAAQFGVQIQLEAAPEAAWVHANSDALIQVMTNLLSNAIKFSPRDEQVYVKITHENHRVRVAITDNGPGIPVNFHGSIFQKFAQADASNARQKGGTGLGLSISRAIIERLQGSIDFVTSPDNGTTFFFELPELR